MKILSSIWVKSILLFLLSALLFYVQSYFIQAYLLLFVLFIPLFLLHSILKDVNYGTTFFLVITFFLLYFWNVVFSHWLQHSIPNAVYMISFLNTILYFFPFLGFQLLSKSKYNKYSFIVFIVLFLLCDYYNTVSVFGYPCFLMGYSLAVNIHLIQWYEYTGVMGGTLWILVVNILIFKFLINKSKKQALIVISAILSPILISILLEINVSKTAKKINVSIYHTNRDEENRKRTGLFTIIDSYADDCLKKLPTETSLLVWPENSVIPLKYLSRRSNAIRYLQGKFAQNRSLSLLTGCIAIEEVDDSIKTKENGSVIVYKENKPCIALNTALMISPIKPYEYRTKQKFVPIEEFTHHRKYLEWLENIFPRQNPLCFALQNENPTCFINDSVAIGSLICYEALYGNFTRKFVNLGANLLVIISNDTWYKNSLGLEKMKQIAIVRAIENRRSVIRASNQGVSCFISAKGEIISSFDKSQYALLTQTIELHHKRTFYTNFGF